MKQCKFKEHLPEDPEWILRSYQHVDNGGFWVCLAHSGAVTFEAGFFGYSSSLLTFGPDLNLESLIKTLQEGKRRLEEQRIMNELKGVS